MSRANRIDGLVVAALLGATSTAVVGCGGANDAAALLSSGADETEVWDNETEPEVPEGEQRLRSSWYEDEDTDALDINRDVADRLESSGFDVSCDEPGEQPDTGAPLVECRFNGPDAEGTYVLQGGGPVPEGVDTDGIAISLTASIFAT